jgi:hypothetical protein
MNHFAMHPVRKLPLIIRTPKQFHTLILLLEQSQRFPSQSAGS